MASESAAERVWRDIEAIRERAPLVHNITNYVAMNSTANALLALGASPIMAHAPEEVEELVAISGALVLNIGTLSAPWIESMARAAAAARKAGIPIVLDPVGAGASRLRTDTSRRLLEEARPTIVRGNPSEIIALSGGRGGTKGVDSTDPVEAAEEAGKALVVASGCVVSISGATDVVIGPDRTLRIRNGTPLMARVTALGCTATALTGAFAAVNLSTVDAAAHAMATLGVAGEIAAELSYGPGTLQVHIIDVLYRMTLPDLAARLRLEG